MAVDGTKTGMVLDTAAIIEIMKQVVSPVSDDVRELRASITQVLSELRESNLTLGRRVDALELKDRGTQALAGLQTLQTRVDALEDAVKEFRQVVKILKWIASGLGGLLLLLLWGIFTGQVEVIFK